MQHLLHNVAGEDARVVITGATSGIGKELAQQFLRHSAVSLLLGCRDVRLAERLFRRYGDSVQVVRLELLDPDSVQSFADEVFSFLGTGGPGLRLLVSNAGVMRPPQERKGGIVDATWQTNFLGPFLLTELLARRRATCRSPQPVRVVHVSSRLERRSQLDEELLKQVAARSQLSGNPYADSKRALMLWTSVRAQSLGFRGGLWVHATTPGMVDTDLGRYSVRPWLWPLTKPLRMMLLRSAAEGALAAAAAGLRKEATDCFGRYYDGEVQLEDLVLERMGEKRFAVDLVKWATEVTALEARAAGYDR